MQKTKKSRAILSGISVLLVLCLLAGGTMAWFTDTEKVNTNFAAGILDVSVKPGEEGQTALSFENLRPMLYENFYKELADNGNETWDNDVTQGGTTGLGDKDYRPVPAYFKPVDITNEGTLPTKVKLSLEAGDGCAAGEPILTDDNITIKQDGSTQDCANRLAPVLKVFVYKLVGEDWTLVEGVNLNTAYDEDAANPDGVASENTAEEANSTYMTAMIPANGTAQYVIAGYLPETVGNAYQGQHYHGNLVLNAYQMDDTAAGNPDEGGSSSEDPDDPDRFNDNVTIEWRENTADGTPVQSRKVTVKSDTTIAAADYDAPQGYVYSPAAADQSSAVTVDDETGVATPATVVFTVVPEEAKTIEYVLYYQNTVNDQLLTETKKVSLEVPGEYTIATPDLAGRTVTITAPLPEGYVFDPAAQSFNVSVDAKGVATPKTITFDVKPEDSGEEPGPNPGTDPDPEEHPEAYQVRVDFRDTETGALLDQSYSKTYSGLSKASHSFTPVAEAQTDTATAHYVTAPEGYEYDPAVQLAQFVTIPVVNGPKVIEFTVKEVGSGEEPGTDPDPEEHPEAYQVRVDFRDTETGALLDQSYSKTYSGLSKASHSFTPVAEAQTDTATAHYVTAPEGYEYDPAVQLAQFVTIPVVNGPKVIEFTVKEADSGEEPGTDPEEPENPDCERDDHIIRDAEDLYNVRLHPHCNFVFANDVDLSEAYPNWEPIGELKRIDDWWYGTYYEPTENVFTGDMNGNGHKVTGLNVGTLKSYNGLFTYSSGTIRNLTVEDAVVNAHSVSGILVGWNVGTIENCTVSGTVTAGDPLQNIWQVGGIVGDNDTNGVIRGCASFADVSGNPFGYPYQTVHYYYGGIAGSNSGTVTDSYSIGTIKGARAGGLIGLNNGDVSNCYTVSTVYAQTDSFGNIDTYTHPSIGELGDGTVDAESIFFLKGNLYRGSQLFTGWDNDKYRGYGKTEEEMKNASTYLDAGWDTSVWNLVDGEYPTLK